MAPRAHPSRAGSLHLLGNHPVLDFTNTSSGRGGAEWLDHLQQPDHLRLWAVHAGVIAAAAAVDVSADGLARALALREAVYRAALTLRQGGAVEPGDMAVILAEQARSLPLARLVPGPESGCWQWPQAGDERVILGPLAVGALDLLTQAPLVRLHACPGQDCGWLFLDLSKSGRRRWCDMAVCGNRAKAQRHRHKPHQG